MTRRCWCCRSPARRPSRATAPRSSWPADPASSPPSATSCICRATHMPCWPPSAVDASRCREHGANHASRHATARPRASASSCGAPGRAAGRSTTSACRPPSPPIGCSCAVLPRGQLVVLPAAQARRRAGGESVLEEIYYFEIAPSPTGGPGTGFHRVYGPGIDVLAEVRDGDVVLVPYGWHGPSMASLDTTCTTST